MSEVMWEVNFVTLNSISEADLADKIEKLVRWASVHDAAFEVAAIRHVEGGIVKISRAQLSGAELEALKYLAKQHKDYVPNNQLVSICNTLFYCGAARVIGLYRGDETMSVPRCLECGKECPDLKGHIVIRSHQREWICQECWEAIFGKEEGEEHADSH